MGIDFVFWRSILCFGEFPSCMIIDIVMEDVMYGMIKVEIASEKILLT